ncbi:uncharacterized protein LOC122369870 [Amphibalanus amphitrite]|uniref:uncharacterized protein LOC122369870 n=1 Tax=Amphibalanus amphitrite TaxID=1232801 RepID=UPI001C92B93E|nr:uncharacterized protein LOC122369870 [Amphibalanus amphitrite]
MGAMLWMCVPLLAVAQFASTQSSSPGDCSRLSCSTGHECRLRHTCDSDTGLSGSYLPPCRDRAECVPSVTCAGHQCQRGHHCRLEVDPAPRAAQFRPPLQRAVCHRTLSCDELRCPPGERCAQRELCDHSLQGYLPPCQTIFECGPETGRGTDEGRVVEVDGETAVRIETEKAQADVGSRRGGGEAPIQNIQVTSSAEAVDDLPTITVYEPTAEEAGEKKTSPEEKDGLLEQLLNVVEATPSPAIQPAVQTTDTDRDENTKVPLGEIQTVLLDETEDDTALSAISGSAGSLEQTNDGKTFVSTVENDSLEPLTTPEISSEPEQTYDANKSPDSEVENLNLFSAVAPNIQGNSLAEPKAPEEVYSAETETPSNSAPNSVSEQISKSAAPAEPLPAPELEVAPESFADILVLTPESLRSSESESTPASDSSLFDDEANKIPPARRSIGTRSCAETRCVAGRRCVLQNSLPTCRKLTCKDLTCKDGARCVIMGGVPVCRPPPTPRPAAFARPSAASSCNEARCTEDQKCVMAGGRAWCTRRRTCANLRCRYDQFCDARRGLPRCQIRRSCDGVSCADGKVCQLIGRLPRCVVAPRCEDLNCGPNERCISVGGAPSCLAAPACYDRRCPPSQECRVVNDEHLCVDAPTCEELRCGPGKVCREYFGSAKCITATTCANAHCRDDQRCEVRDNLARCVSLRGAPCTNAGGCEQGLQCVPVNGEPICVKPATCDGVRCRSGQRCAVLSGTPTCVASCAAAECAPELFCRVQADRAVCVECELDCPAGQVCKLQEPRSVTSEYVVSRKKIPQCVVGQA